MENNMKEIEQKFWANVNKDTENGCWEWTGIKLQSGGYGRFRFDGIDWRAHRLSVILDGHDPTGLYVCHHCDNPICVNPAHLFLGTHQDNMRDKMEKGRASGGGKKLRKLTDEQIRYVKDSPLSSRKLSAELDITHTCILQIRRGNTYREVV
jgi:hypothetical protein